MAKQTVEALIEGGKATAAPPLGPALGPLGVNIGQVVAEINKKTQSFKGMQVPVKVEVDSDTKAFSISVGTPPAASLILKEAGIQKGAGNPKTDRVADLKIEQVIKIAKMKEDALLGKDLRAKVREIIGTCDSMGVLVEGVPAREANGQVAAGKFDKEISEERTEISAAEMKELEEEKRKLQEELKARRAEYEAKAKAIVAGMEGKTSSEIKKALAEAGLPQQIIDEFTPKDAAAAASGGEKKEKSAAPPKK
ncbi:50S ribosomal protein L11 [Candidatus Woesearchaeota archaeon]|nr:50S ribosomal protein L11 [Candidatus Woesearchaeota archaeon]